MDNQEIQKIITEALKKGNFNLASNMAGKIGYTFTATELDECLVTMINVKCAAGLELPSIFNLIGMFPEEDQSKKLEKVLGVSIDFGSLVHAISIVYLLNRDLSDDELKRLFHAQTEYNNWDEIIQTLELMSDEVSAKMSEELLAISVERGLANLAEVLEKEFNFKLTPDQISRLLTVQLSQGRYYEAASFCVKRRLPALSKDDLILALHGREKNLSLLLLVRITGMPPGFARSRKSDVFIGRIFEQSYVGPVQAVPLEKVYPTETDDEKVAILAGQILAGQHIKARVTARELGRELTDNELVTIFDIQMSQAKTEEDLTDPLLTLMMIKDQCLFDQKQKVLCQAYSDEGMKNLVMALSPEKRLAAETD